MRSIHRTLCIGAVIGAAVAIACHDLVNPTQERHRAQVSNSATGDSVPGDSVPDDSVPGDSVPGDSVPVDTIRPDTGGIALQPGCGNSYWVTNARDTAVVLTYTIGAAARRDTLRLPPRPGNAPTSETYLTTATRGTVRLFTNDTTQVQQADPAPGACPDRARLGQWAPPFSWPVIAVHMHLLPDGTLLTFGRYGSPTVFDPATNVFTPVPSATHVFCSGHSFLPDGRLLVAGGHIANYKGVRDANIYDPATRQWTRAASMARGRWYPSNVTLASGEVLAIGGTDSAGVQVDIPEVWQANGTWRRLTHASKVLPYYPRTFVAPDGRVFVAGPRRPSYWLSTSGIGQWRNGPVMRYSYDRDYASPVMYDAGRILVAGGSGTDTRLPTGTAEVINLNATTPAWTYTGAMAYRRRQTNATVVPTGEVIVTGGTSGLGFNNEAQGLFPAEAWSPVTGKWRTLARAATVRIYHSTTVLLPDGRLLSAGGGDSDSSAGTPYVNHPDGEYFSPPYLFRPDGELARRPTITDVPAVVGYGQAISVVTPDGASIRQARWIRLNSVTHAYDENQRANTLAVTAAPGGVVVTAPANAKLAPPGHYMLFLIDHNGVPSVGRIVQVRP